jgi:hypothetical protein
MGCQSSIRFLYYRTHDAQRLDLRYGIIPLLVVVNLTKTSVCKSPQEVRQDEIRILNHSKDSGLLDTVNKKVKYIFKDESTQSCICLWKLAVAVATYVSICIVYRILPSFAF